MGEPLDGLLSFFASHHAIRAEKILSDAGFEVALVAGPKQLSPNCGVALRFRYAHQEAVVSTLSERSVRVDEVHPYQPDTDRFPRHAGRERRSKGPSRRG